MVLVSCPERVIQGVNCRFGGGIKKAGRHPMRKDILTVERGFASLSELSETPVVSWRADTSPSRFSRHFF